MNRKSDQLGFDTRAIHAGQSPDPSTGAIMTPIYATSTYVQQSPGVHKGYEYSRSHNPTRRALEACISSLEGGCEGFAFASGMSATAAVMEILNSGDHIIASDDLYGGTFRLFENVKKRSSGLEFTFVDMSDPKKLEMALRKNTKMIWVESPTNPMLKLVDLKEATTFAKRHALVSVCDNTFCSPAIQRPLEFGFDMVVHSATKYLNGHSDVIGGIVVCALHREELAQQIKYISNSVGAIMSPFDSFLVLRSLKTLSVRIKKHCANAKAISEFLEKHPMIERVYYPGLASHPQHELAKIQMEGYGGMISVVLKGGIQSAKIFLENTQVFSLAESLGGVESLIEHPAIMTHASVPESIRNSLGIVDGLVRLSVGIENCEDLICDLEFALRCIEGIEPHRNCDT